MSEEPVCMEAPAASSSWLNIFVTASIAGCVAAICVRMVALEERIIHLEQWRVASSSLATIGKLVGHESKEDGGSEDSYGEDNEPEECSPSPSYLPLKKDASDLADETNEPNEETTPP